MQLLELLDKIDATAPRSCQTCRHMATHANCAGCLDGTPRGEEFPYRNWEPGNWLRDLHAAEVNGARNIVIGGSGEADFCATSTPSKVAKHMHYVAEQCGYSVGPLKTADGSTTLPVWVHDGEYVIHWRGARLQKITTIDGRVCWHRDEPSLRDWTI